MPHATASAFVILLATLCATAPAAAADDPAPTLTDAEKSFAKQMSGAALVGSFTLGPGTPAKPERYDLGEVRKLPNGRWLINARIRYGENDVTLPLSLPVEFAGDTAVIVVNNVGFPPLGTYSARVLIHNGKYAGYWQGSGYGGHLFGEIKRGNKPDSEPEGGGEDE